MALYITETFAFSFETHVVKFKETVIYFWEHLFFVIS